METAGEVPMIGLTPYELKKRRETISSLWPTETVGEASFARMFEFASSRHEESSPPQMKMGPGYLQVSIKSAEEPLFVAFFVRYLSPDCSL
jgi:hypothetical protein